jgi:hypothetical protein
MSKRKKIKRLTSKKKSPSPKHIFKITNRIHFKSVENLAGFCVETAKAGEMVKIQARGSLVSDDPLFYIYIDQITSIFLKKVLVNSVYQFLVIIHKDLSADLYFNEVPTKILMMTKRALKRGELIRDNDIADIKELIFESIAIKETDKLIYCFKVGWKFGLFFDLYRDNHPLNLKETQLELGALYRYLCFQYVYDIIDSEPHFEALISDGWFPFIELLGSEFKEISKAYKDPNFSEDRVKKIVDKFGEERIISIIEKWWQNSIFLDKKQILMAGINSYLDDNEEGFITCIKTLLPEIEGIIRLQYFSETGKGKDVCVPDLISHIIKKGSAKTGSELSLFLPRAFFEYLKDCVFAKFDLEAGKVSLSRHTSSHGVARTEDYSKIRALQMILILDQVYFYI